MHPTLYNPCRFLCSYMLYDLYDLYMPVSTQNLFR
jgi:hypothetical protein